MRLRWYNQIVISVAELYGGWMTFVPDVLEGSKSLATDDPVLLWVYLVFMNGVRACRLCVW